LSIKRHDIQKNELILNYTNKKGCDVILDCVGSSEFENVKTYLIKNLILAGLDCRWIAYGTMGGNLIKDFNLGKFLGKRINYKFTTLRSRSNVYKTDLINKFKKEILPGFGESEKFVPIVDSVYSVENIIDAHTKMEENKNIGKIIIKWFNH
jgi:tumor protein p53-inducible protein 3